MNIKVKFEDGSVKNIREIYSVVLEDMVKTYSDELNLRNLLMDGFYGLDEMSYDELIENYFGIDDTWQEYEIITKEVHNAI